ncbi:hypothetical protein QUF64_11875 [Anaerolineales bacterium HSG6]|nr:hypothetical protein [Anaerolineales bacterium HSG6]MDM8532142.1 hypothetical protein [Anaerolineales bacterium HSG25]
MNKLEAARQGKGAIELQEESAEQVRKVVAEVSPETSEDGNLLIFDGKRILEGHGFNLEVNCFDVYECGENGYLLHTYMVHGSNWAVSGKTIKQMLKRAPDQRIAKRVHGIMVQKGLASFQSH